MQMKFFATGLAFFASAAAAQIDQRTTAVLAVVQADLGADGFGQGASYAVTFSDLNDDHNAEAIVHLAGPNFCGSGGCTTYVLTETEAGWWGTSSLTSAGSPSRNARV